MDKKQKPDESFGTVANQQEEGPVDVTAKKISLAKLFHSLKSTLFRRPSKKHLIAVSGIGLAVLAIGIGALRLLGPKAAEPNPEPVVVSNYVPPEAPKFYSPLTGVEVAEELTKKPVTGVMIENSVDARPQSGLYDAGVVFEAIAEGGITRFLALYQESQPSSIGPIRSARPYYVRWAAGFDAAYVHSGGSGEALQLIGSIGIKDLDHGALGERIASRASSRYAPHNVYSSMDRIESVRNEKGFTSSTFEPFTRLNDETKRDLPTSPAQSIQFDISSPLYDTSYTYDSDSKLYKRTMANTPHNDQESGKQIAPRVVISLYMGYSIHPDGIHSVYNNIGSGKAVVFQNGVATEAMWEKSSDKASLVLKAADGGAMPLEAGQKWITALPEGRVTYGP